MKDIDLRNFLDDESWDYEQKKIEQMLETELEKEPEDIDMELVDACMEYLTKSNDVTLPAKKNHHKRIKLGRFLAAAVIVVITVSIALTAYAKANDVKITDAIVTLFDDYAAINFSKKDTAENDFTKNVDADIPYDSTKLYKELEEGGIKDIHLPVDLFYVDYNNSSWYNSIVSNDFGCDFNINDKSIVIDIETFTDKKWVTDPNIMGHFTASKKVVVNGVDVYLFEEYGNKPKKVNTSISYQIGLTQYFIHCYYTIEEAEEFIKSMK